MIELRTVMVYEDNQWREIDPNYIKRGMIFQMLDHGQFVSGICRAMSDTYTKYGIPTVQVEYCTPDQI